VTPVATESTPTLDASAIALTLGGGVDDFVGEDMRDNTNTGGSWNVRATFGTDSYLALEAAYIGSAQSIDAFGLDSDAVLVGNGAQAGLRVNATRYTTAQPFIYSALAWRHYDITNTDINTSDIEDSDDVFEIPVGVGIAGKFGMFTVDARGEYRFAADEDMAPTDSPGTASMDRWGVMANIGVEI
jgi:hypothetical protein